jgi:ficolin
MDASKWHVFSFTGNDAIHDLTTMTHHDLRIDLQRFNGDKAYALYSKFEVGDEISKYKLSVGGYSGTAGMSVKCWILHK